MAFRNDDYMSLPVGFGVTIGQDIVCFFYDFEFNLSRDNYVTINIISGVWLHVSSIHARIRHKGSEPTLTGAKSLKNKKCSKIGTLPSMLSKLAGHGGRFTNTYTMKGSICRCHGCETILSKRRLSGLFICD